jgi:sporulation protein YlmC with PRC-barrel domain
MGEVDQPAPPGATMTAGVHGPPASTVRLQEVLGRVVVDAAGRHLGRVVDCVAEAQGDELRVTALLVGPGAWAARFGPKPGQGGRRVPWEDIAALAPHITLRTLVGDKGH